MTTVLKCKSVLHSFQFSPVCPSPYRQACNRLQSDIQRPHCFANRKGLQVIGKKNIVKSRIDPFSAKHRCQKNPGKKDVVFNSSQATVIILDVVALFAQLVIGAAWIWARWTRVCFIRISQIKAREGAMDNDARCPEIMSEKQKRTEAFNEWK